MAASLCGSRRSLCGIGCSTKAASVGNRAPPSGGEARRQRSSVAERRRRRRGLSAMHEPPDQTNLGVTVDQQQPWVLPLDRVGRDDLSLAGGKGANLGELIRA